MDYWHSILTERSWQVLQELKGRFPFILIGGWAVYLWAHTHKSKDIDIIVDFDTLSQLKQQYDLRKNNKLQKYEIKIDGIDIDIYVPHYSRLIIPVETIKTEQIEGFTVARPEYLLILKQGAELARKESEKGEKDRIDILSLLFNCAIDFQAYYQILKTHHCEHLLPRLKAIVRGFREASYLNLTPRQLKLKKQAVLEQLKRVK